MAEGAEGDPPEDDASAEVSERERRQRQREAFQKIVEAGQVPPVLPQPPRVEPTHRWELSENDKKLLRSIKIDPDK